MAKETSMKASDLSACLGIEMAVIKNSAYR